MTTLLIRLAGPMQAWGAASRFSRRETRHEPTKSGVVGLLAASQGRLRTDPVEDLAGLRFGVRVDQPGSLLRDFQTARTLDGERSMPLSYRFYLSDAVFVAAIEGPESLIGGLGESLRTPTFPLYLGRRSCPPSLPLQMSVTEEELLPALTTAPWQAATWYRRKQARSVHLRIASDAIPGELGEKVRDTPVSFDPRLRQYEWRTVVETFVPVDNPEGTAAGHDAMAVFGGA